MACKTSKITYSYYLNIRKNAAILTVMVMMFFMALSSIILYNNTAKSIEDSELSKSSMISTQVSDYFNLVAYMCAFSSRYTTIPDNNLNQQDKYLTNKIILDNINSYLICFDYIAGVSIDTGTDVLATGNEFSEQLTEIGVYKFCTVSCSSADTWPHIIKFQYKTSTIDGYDVSIYLNANKLSALIFPKNCYLLTKSRTILMSTNQQDYGKTIDSLYKIPMKKIMRDSNTFKYYMGFENVEDSSFCTLTVVNKSDYFGQYATVLFIVLFIGIVLTVLIITITGITIKMIYAPIGQIVKTFKYHLPDDIESFENEISYINRCIAETIQSKSELEQKLPEALIKVKKAQAYALHSQISPHFLSNTLDNIKWMSIENLGIDNSIEQCLVLLNKMLNESMNQREITTTLENELKLTDIYITIMKICYLDKFDIVWDVEENLLNCIILKFTIQPIIENSIIHGFSQKCDGQKIIIRIFEQNGNLNVYITDNGTGITSEKLADIRFSLENIEDETGQHIGMRNIQAKINLIFGKAYGIKVLESDSNGTHIELLLPYETVLK